MVKRLSLLIPLVSALTACAAAPASTDDLNTASQAVSDTGQLNNPKYLALGDSVAFGYSPLLPYTSPWTQFVSYADDASDALYWRLTNAACPGETTDSLLDVNGFPNTGCHTGGLKADYAEFGATTQIDYAVAYLKSQRDTKLVTLNIGGNDLQLPFYLCGASPVAVPPSAYPCIQAQIPVMFAKYQQNLDTILGRIRGSGYDKLLVVVNQYALNYADPGLTPLIAQLNSIATAVAAQHGAIVSDSFAAFQQASASFGGDSCAAGLLIPLPGGGCDLHPTPKGAQLISDTLVAAIGQ